MKVKYFFELIFNHPLLSADDFCPFTSLVVFFFYFYKWLFKFLWSL